jgi:hypothetical protein
MKKKVLKKAQSGMEVNKLKPAPSDTTRIAKPGNKIEKSPIAVKKAKGFYTTPESVGGKSGNIDPAFFKKPEKVGGKSGNIDPGFLKKPPKQKKGGSVKK